MPVCVTAWPPHVTDVPGREVHEGQATDAHLTFYSAQRLDLFAWCVRLSRLLVGFRTHFKSLHFLLLLLLLLWLIIVNCTGAVFDLEVCRQPKFADVQQ